MNSTENGQSSAGMSILLWMLAGFSIIVNYVYFSVIDTRIFDLLTLNDAVNTSAKYGLQFAVIASAVYIFYWLVLDRAPKAFSSYYRFIAQSASVYPEVHEKSRFETGANLFEAVARATFFLVQLALLYIAAILSIWMPAAVLNFLLSNVSVYSTFWSLVLCFPVVFILYIIAVGSLALVERLHFLLLSKPFDIQPAISFLAKIIPVFSFGLMVAVFALSLSYRDWKALTTKDCVGTHGKKSVDSSCIVRVLERGVLVYDSGIAALELRSGNDLFTTSYAVPHSLPEKWKDVELMEEFYHSSERGLQFISPIKLFRSASNFLKRPSNVENSEEIES